ncbi:prion-inhibition and propagation-domain-containing protein [Hypoxylon crocopeplum]|nr:prion-inhibition and propagation-domain-containing protein [Hypoxylon crocopeplum]
MAEVAGLAIGVLGIAGLFTSCIENFNIVVRAREFSEEFELLCTQLALQQIRLVIWGETLGLVPPSPSKRTNPYHRALERKDIQPAIEATINQLQSLLTRADAITGRYASEEQEKAAGLSDTRPASDSKGMSIFRESYQRFKGRIKRNQKEKSVWQVTRWSIHDYERFEHLITNIRALVDALESITSALGVLAQQQSILIDEIESLSDESSLDLLQRIGSSDSAPLALKTVSDTASVRLTFVTSSSRSYHTAKTEQSHGGTYNHRRAMLSKALAAEVPLAQRRVKNQDSERTKTETPAAPETSRANNTIADLPQHQRWMAALSNGKAPEAAAEPAFSTKDLHYGEALRTSRKYDDKVCRDNSAKLAAEAHEGLPLARRMFLELRNIRRADVPFISAAPVGDMLDRILASIEGPPGTPYEGGIFWITVKIVESKPPTLRFQTKIYHPNIDPRGKVCADYASWWRDASLLNRLGSATRQRALPWFSEHITNHYSLGSLLVALCGLLASPNVDDPLVPEIAETYLTDHEAYYKAAQLYTQRFAHSERPDDTELVFPEEDSRTEASLNVAEYRRKPITESIAPQRDVVSSSMIWERIPSYRLTWTTLEESLSKWFPGVDFIYNKTCKKLGTEYCVALPRSLTSAQRHGIHKLRTIYIERETGDEETSSDSSDDSM